jgi:hypothetical protein
MRRLLAVLVLAPACCLVAVLAAPAALAGAPIADDGGATWRLEQPLAPPRVPGEHTVPEPLGKVGDIEFWAPNRGLLITAGNGDTIKPSVWAYNGQTWHLLATECGASDGRIAWAGPDEFWTISDGRPGQADNARGETPPLEDNTLCHFEKAASEKGEVAGSYASLAFQPSSYQPVHAAACVSSSDCWFAGDRLPEGQAGAFHLHWNGSSVAPEPYPPEGHSIEDMRKFGTRLYESVRFRAGDVSTETPLEPPALHIVNPAGVSPRFEKVGGVPIYSANEFPEALEYLHLSSGEGALWAAAGPQGERPPEGSEQAEVTVARLSGGAWQAVLGPQAEHTGNAAFPGDVVDSIAAEPGTNDAWIALDTIGDASERNPTETAHVARVNSEGVVSEEDDQRLPSSGEGSPRGAAAKIACPAAHDCWVVTTQGWLFHLAPESQRTLPEDTDPAFSHLITFRPADAGVPQVTPTTLPEDDSGLGRETRSEGSLAELSSKPPEAVVTLPLISNVHSRLIHGSTLDLSFHVAVKARIKLVAKRHRTVVAATPARIFRAGNRQLLLKLDPRRWPTKLSMQTRALAPLPTVSARSESVGTVSTSMFVLPSSRLLSGLGTP